MLLTCIRVGQLACKASNGLILTSYLDVSRSAAWNKRRLKQMQYPSLSAYHLSRFHASPAWLRPAVQEAPDPLSSVDYPSFQRAGWSWPYGRLPVKALLTFTCDMFCDIVDSTVKSCDLVNFGRKNIS